MKRIPLSSRASVLSPEPAEGPKDARPGTHSEAEAAVEVGPGSRRAFARLAGMTQWFSKQRCALMLAAVLLVLTPALAVQPDEMLRDPKLEARARSIGKELRCLVCQNQSIDDSDAPLAHDLRVLVRRRLLKGDSDDAVKQYIVARYGTYVLLKPPFDPETYLLWFGPLLLVLTGGATVYLFYRRRAAPETAPLSDEELRRLKSLMDDAP